jgi:hypothetical protein
MYYPGFLKIKMVQKKPEERWHGLHPRHRSSGFHLPVAMDDRWDCLWQTLPCSPFLVAIISGLVEEVFCSLPHTWHLLPTYFCEAALVHCASGMTRTT